MSSAGQQTATIPKELQSLPTRKLNTLLLIKCLKFLNESSLEIFCFFNLIIVSQFIGVYNQLKTFERLKRRNFPLRLIVECIIKCCPKPAGLVQYSNDLDKVALYSMQISTRSNHSSVYMNRVKYRIPYALSSAGTIQVTNIQMYCLVIYRVNRKKALRKSSINKIN